MSKDRPREREEWKPKIRSQSTSRNDKHVIHTTLKYIAGIEVFRILHKRTLYAGAQCRSVSCHFSAWHEWVFKEPEQKKRIIETWIMDIHVMYITSTNTIFFSYIYSHAGVCICKTETKKKKSIKEMNRTLRFIAKQKQLMFYDDRIFMSIQHDFIFVWRTQNTNFINVAWKMSPNYALALLLPRFMLIHQSLSPIGNIMSSQQNCDLYFLIRILTTTNRFCECLLISTLSSQHTTNWQLDDKSLYRTTQVLAMLRLAWNKFDDRHWFDICRRYTIQSFTIWMGFCCEAKCDSNRAVMIVCVVPLEEEEKHIMKDTNKMQMKHNKRNKKKNIFFTARMKRIKSNGEEWCQHDQTLVPLLSTTVVVNCGMFLSLGKVGKSSLGFAIDFCHDKWLCCFADDGL